MNKITEEDIKTLCYMYNKGCSHTEIAKAIGIHRLTVSDKISKLVAMGVLSKRDDHGRVKDTTEIKMALAEQGYKDGKSLEQIAREIGVAVRTVSKYLVVLKASGRLPDERKKTVKTNGFKKRREGRNVNGSFRTFAKGESTLKDGEWVNCTLAVSKTCIYGIEGGNGWNGKCRYILCEGHSRGCSHKHCTRYSKVSADNPRRTYLTEEMI